jgi:hypothetical protein
LKNPLDNNAFDKHMREEENRRRSTIIYRSGNRYGFNPTICFERKIKKNLTIYIGTKNTKAQIHTLLNNGKNNLVLSKKCIFQKEANL